MHLTDIGRSDIRRAEHRGLEGRDRLAALQAVASGLAGSLSPADVADVIVARGSAVLGGQAASLCLLLDDGETLDVVRELGATPQGGERCRRLPLSAPFPACDALRRSEVVVVRSIAERDARYPDLARMPLATQSFVALPLTHDGQPIGVFSIGFAEPREFDADEIEFLESLADLCTLALDRARLFAETVEARTEAERAAERLGFLARATAMVGASLDPDATVAATAQLAVPRLADMCAILIADDETGELRPVFLEHVDPEQAGRLEEAIHTLWRHGGNNGVTRLIRKGEPRWFSPVTVDLLSQIATDYDEIALLEQLDLVSVGVVPLVARGRLAGALLLGHCRTRILAAEDQSLAGDLAARSAVAIDNARLFRERESVAATLQQNLLPPRLPAIPGVDLAPLYAAAGQGEVGGDFYDAFEAADDQWLLVIGDVRGKGIEAARLTSLVHHSIRSLALRAKSPAAILRQLNEVLVHTADELESEPRFCTVLILALRHSGDGLDGTLAVAGHPLPVLARRQGPMESAGSAGDVLGVMAEVEIHDMPIRLERGDVLALFTDGIVERHAGADFFGESGICAVLDAARDQPADVIATRLEEAASGFAPRSPRDDMAALIVRATG